ncbi:hypothetical protein SAY87_008739 [Trapa incisa]|uniref:Uncharacterized protein n=1 Tax=Trapa incisa TaxID=236973 RepID=A0AAN7PVI9_9MYRT|nr:hypothetical protein SAY87_008739 [Trapa incisa]
MSSLAEKHVAVIPFPAISHARPLANLVLKLAAETPRVHFSFLADPGHNDVLSDHSSADAPPANVKVFGTITWPWVNHMPGKSRDKMLQLFLEEGPKNFEAAIGAAEQAVGVKASCLLTDAFYTFACMIAEKMQVKWVPLVVCSPYFVSAYVHYDQIRKCLLDAAAHEEVSSQPDRRTVLEGIPGLSRMRVEDLPDGPAVFTIDSHVLSSSEELALVRTFCEFRSVLPRAAAVVMSSFEEVNSKDLLEDLRSRFKELLLAGSLTASLTPPPPHDSAGSGCLQWLNRQKHRSVAYISFGSVNSPPPEEMSALADALEASKTPYLWSLKDELKSSLPLGVPRSLKTLADLISS